MKKFKNIKPIVSYLDPKKSKDIISKQNKNKSAIYRWTNLITGLCYIGSANNLSIRFKDYLTIYYLKRTLKRSKSIICNSLLKNGYENFRLDILEYITFPAKAGMDIKEKKKILLEREQFYLDILKPEYNILKKAGSRLGAKHSAESKKLIGQKSLGRRHSQETLRKLSAIRGHPVFIYKKCDLKGFQLIGSFLSIKKASEFLGISAKTVGRYRKLGKIYKNQYKFLAEDF